jgi:biotin synthase
MNNSRLDELLSVETFTRDHLIALLSLSEPEDLERLFHRADEVRRREVGDVVHMRGIIEISNHCACNCLYCGLRAGNRELERYSISVDEIVERALEVAALPIGTIVIQSGEGTPHSAEEIADAIRRIKAAADVAITLSLGQHPDAAYRLWLDAGADRYLLKHETANRELFSYLKPDTDFDERIACLRALREIGFQVGSGNMIGLPGQAIADIADDILLCRDLASDMCTFGPFIPSPYTPLADAATGTVGLSLKTLAVARIVLRDAHIPANTALGTIDPTARARSFHCGTNVIMPNFTPLRFRRNYKIYPKQMPEQEDLRRSYDETVALIRSQGRIPGTGKGHSVKKHAPAP